MKWHDVSWFKSHRPPLISQIIAIPIAVGWLLFA